MMDRLRAIAGRIKEWWDRFETRQKTIIISIAAAVIVMFALLIFLLSRPQYEVLVVCENATEASQVVELLGDEYNYITSADGLTISILESQAPEARILLGANNITSSAYTIENVFSGGFGETESDKQKKYLLYQETKYAMDIEAFEFVKSARVNLYKADNDGTLLSAAAESNASVILELEDGVSLPEDVAIAIAKTIANQMGNSGTDKVTIIDTNGNLLFSDDADVSVAGTASAQMKATAQMESVVRNNVQRVLLGIYTDVQVSPSLSVDFATYTSTVQEYYAPDGQTQGMLDSADIYTEDSTNGTVGGTPGTDSNTDQTYVYQSDTSSTSSISDEHYDYLPNTSIETQSIPAGVIDPTQSSVSVTAVSYKIIKEEDVRTQGLLSGLTWDEYKLANSEKTKLTVDSEIYSLVSNATRIPVEDITIIAYEEPVFYDAQGLNITFADVIQIVVFVLIIGALAFVVLRSMSRSRAGDEETEELSVETLLQSKPDEIIENIEVESKSGTRKMIEKFVEDNPEAAANLLRNWINEDWG